ncbi:venom metalloproteinase 3-like isoform X2 [Diachasmimorpha longicaudata]
MKKIIFVLFCSFFHLDHCAKKPKCSSTIDFNVFRDETYGLAQITLPRVGSSSWNFCILFDDNTENQLNLKLSEGILANIHTPVWFANGSPRNKKVSYKLYEKNLTELGKFDFYQDHSKRSAIVVFHDLKRIEGFVGYYKFQVRKDGPPGNKVMEYILKDPKPKKLASLFRTNQRSIKKKSAAKIRTLQDLFARVKSSPRGSEATFEDTSVYPQLLVQVAVSRNWTEAVIQMLAYWNAVDMLFRVIDKPAVKINIAGFIVPQNNFTTAWIENAKIRDAKTGVDKIIIDRNKALAAQGAHFTRISKIFDSRKFDFMFAFYNLGPGETANWVGAAYRGPCHSRMFQVATIKNKINNYIAGAHELGHLLNATHDIVYPMCKESHAIMSVSAADGDNANLLWSECTTDAISAFFK